jgi:hypothetical protein
MLDGILVCAASLEDEGETLTRPEEDDRAERAKDAFTMNLDSGRVGGVVGEFKENLVRRRSEGRHLAGGRREVGPPLSLWSRRKRREEGWNARNTCRTAGKPREILVCSPHS